MSAFLDAFEGTFTIDLLWSSLAVVAAVLGTMVIFAFGYRVLRRVLTGASRGKAKL